AAKQGLVDQLANLLKQNGACVEEKDACGCTPLILAAREGHVAIVKLLLDNGAKIEASDRAAYTCLMSAAEEGHSSVVSVLLDCGAD
ncbi:ankyrin repeat protein, partial [Fusarium redolens]